MVDEAEFSQALEKICAATLSESFWPDALRTVGRTFDSDFTPAKCCVAQALAAGQSPGDYADAAGLGIRAVRTHIS